jgi:LPS-assembly protein
MIRIFLFLTLPLFFLYAEMERIKVFGSNGDMKDDKIVIYNSFLIKKGIFLSAKTIIYDKEMETITAKGDVYLNYQGDNNFILSNYVFIDLKSKIVASRPFFLFSFNDNSWVSANYAENKNDTLYFAKNGIASTCEVNNPDWKIVASSVSYDKKRKWLSLNNPVLYLKDIPILYLPYLGYSLDKTRSSGFLKPLFGFSANEGFLFTLPYYQTLGAIADLELDPTIRTKRGNGLYSTFRFVNSATGRGEFKIGEFKDYKRYSEKYDLANSSHRGWSFLYQNRGIISKNDKLYIDLKNANDVDYFYLDAYNYTFNTSYLSSKVLTSTINYINSKDNDFVGIYGKYFKDTSKLSNADTMQLLPQLNYHKFNSVIGDSKDFLYSLDMNIYNYTREKGTKEFKKSILFPITYEDSFFDDYMKLGVTEQFNYSQVESSDGNVSETLSLDTFLKLYSNLSRIYPNFIHNIVPSVTFGMNNFTNKKGPYNPYIDKVELKKSISFKLYQYLLSDYWNLFHEVSAVYYIDNEEQNSEFSALRNSLTFNYGDYYLKENNKFSLKENKVDYNSLTMGYLDSIKFLQFSHIFQRKTDFYSSSKSFDIKGSYKFDKIHKMFGEFNYDLFLNMEKFYSVGISMSKKCWNYSISYKKETIPLLTNGGISSIIQKTIYFEIELIPLGGISQQYQFKPEEKGN